MTQTENFTSVRHPPAWPKDTLLIGFGVIWAVDAALKSSPAFRAGYPGYLTSASQGQPSWLHPWFNFWIHLQHRTVVWAYVTATVETLTVGALILGFARKSTYLAAALFSLLI
ncbi:MAG TPA: hypothetical protein VMW80_10075 [Candidatus Dormibacteraeota bacterium]|nr:hypothetical protein [Candidatus Dormibacteraeota bacterium]